MHIAADIYKVTYDFTGEAVFIGSLKACKAWRANHGYATMYSIRFLG